MKIIAFIKENRSFTLIFFGAALVRFIHLGDYQFSYDELSALSRTTYTNWHDLINYGSQIDAHPVLIQCFLFALVKVVGYSEALIKLPFILMSLGTLIYAYLFSLRWFGKAPALISAAIFSFSFIFLHYSVLARMYASGVFFTVAFTWYWFIVLFDEKRNTKHYVWMSVFILLCALNSHISCLYVLFCGVIGLVFQRKERMLKYVISCAAAVLLYLPHLSITLFQLDYGGIGVSQNGWLAPPDKLVLFGFLRALLGTGFVWVFFALAFIAGFALRKDLIDKKAFLLFFIFFLNYGVIHYYSVNKAPIFQYSVMLFSAPCFIWAFTSFFNFGKRVDGIVPVLCCAALLFQSFGVKHFYRDCVKHQNNYVYNKVVESENKFGKQHVAAAFFDTEKLFVLQYEIKNKHQIKYRIFDEDIFGFNEFLKNTKADHLILGNADPLYVEMARNVFPYISESLYNANINYCLLSKHKAEGQQTRLFKCIDSSNYLDHHNYWYDVNPALVTFSDKSYEYRVDSLNEYPFSFGADLNKISNHEGQVILISAEIQSAGPLENAGLHFSLSNKKDSIVYFSGPELKNFYKEGAFYKVFAEFYLGTNYKRWRNETKLKCFFWNRGKQKFIVRNFNVRTLDYWPLKWQIWK